MVGEALKGGKLVACVMSELGYNVTPDPNDSIVDRPSLITAITMGSEEKMV